MTRIVVIMARTFAYNLLYAPVVREHLRFIEAKHHSLIRDSISQQLQHAPLVETRNRKPLRRTPTAFEAEWELRFGPGNRFRAFYKVDQKRNEVRVAAVGVKDRERLLIAGQEIDL